MVRCSSVFYKLVRLGLGAGLSCCLLEVQVSYEALQFVLHAPAGGRGQDKHLCTAVGTRLQNVLITESRTTAGLYLHNSLKWPLKLWIKFYGWPVHRARSTHLAPARVRVHASVRDGSSLIERPTENWSFNSHTSLLYLIKSLGDISVMVSP